MYRFVKPVVVAALAAVGVLAFSAGSAKAQVPVYGPAYATPYPAAGVGVGVGIGTFYNAINGVPAPFLPSYAPYGSYYNYVNRPVVVVPAPVYGGYYHRGHYSHHRHWHW